jgi:EAL domain-containing protein (putative c-di-GMP-specific phosphodiesterase class I)
MMRLHNKGFLIPLSVNYSSHQFERDDIVCRTVEILDECDFPGDFLEIEITESVLIGNLEKTITKLRELKNLGIRIVLDDFGTGYSSLTYMIDLPIDALKLDGAFVRSEKRNGRLILLESIMRMADKLGLSIVAEGVETAEQLDRLMKIGRPVIQGYYYSKPLPYDALARYLVAPGSVRGPTVRQDN